MRIKIFCIGVMLLSSLASAQAPTTPELHLRGNRFKPLTYDQLTPEQKTMVDHLLSGERAKTNTGTNGPFNVTLRSPEMGDLAQKLGTQVRFHSSLPTRLNEMAILMTARFWNSQYEWSAHHRDGAAAGLSQAVIEAIAAGRRPKSMQVDEEIVYNFANELLWTRQVSDSSFNAMINKFGERGAVDLTGVLGYYCFVAMMLNIDRYPLQPGDNPELKLLPNPPKPVM